MSRYPGPTLVLVQMVSPLQVKAAQKASLLRVKIEQKALL